jgi:hypothetical protein
MRAWNLIVAGYAPPRRSTGVASVGGGGWRDFGSRRGSSRLPIELDQAQLRRSAGMAEKRHFVGGRLVAVARLASHGQEKGERGQALGPDCRLMAGLTARPISGGRQVARGGAASPFRPAPGVTRVASASRQIHEIQAQVGPYLCLTLRSGEPQPSDRAGRGRGTVLANPQNGVGGIAPVVRPSTPTGADAPSTGARTGSASREGCAESGFSGRLKHGARAPFVERSCGSYGAVGETVNRPVNAAVDNAK